MAAVLEMVAECPLYYCDHRHLHHSHALITSSGLRAASSYVVMGRGRVLGGICHSSLQPLVLYVDFMTLRSGEFLGLAL